MAEDSGFFEEMNSEDTEEVELSATEESYENIEQFKESAVYAEVDGVLREAGAQTEEEEILTGNSQIVDQEQGQSGIKVIYVQRNSVSSSQESISDNAIVVLDPAQFEVLVDRIDNVSVCDPAPREELTVSMNDYSEKLDKMQMSLDSMLLVTIMIFSLCFGYMVKETVFRGI